MGTPMGLFPKINWRGLLRRGEDTFVPRYTSGCVFSCLALLVLVSETALWLMSESQPTNITEIMEFVGSFCNRAAAIATLVIFSARSDRHAAYVRKWNQVKALLLTPVQHNGQHQDTHINRLGAKVAAITFALAVLQCAVVKEVFLRKNSGFSDSQVDITNTIKLIGTAYIYFYNNFVCFYCCFLCIMLRIGFENVSIRLATILETHQSRSSSTGNKRCSLHRVRSQHHILCELVAETHQFLSPSLLLICVSVTVGICLNTYMAAVTIISTRNPRNVALYAMGMLLQLIPMSALSFATSSMAFKFQKILDQIYRKPLCQLSEEDRFQLQLILSKSKRNDARISASGFLTVNIELLMKVICTCILVD